MFPPAAKTDQIGVARNLRSLASLLCFSVEEYDCMAENLAEIPSAESPTSDSFLSV